MAKKHSNRESEYLIRITRVDGGPVYLRPGGKGERELVATVVEAALGKEATSVEAAPDVATAVIEAAIAKGVGVFRTEAQVRKRLQEAFDDVCGPIRAEQGLQIKTLRRKLTDAFNETLRDLKTEVVP
jgi:hypothetical protein